jgi:hypothetical protein
MILKDEWNYVVLFTDIMMPEMDGIELVREARKICPEIVPIVMTGYATLETARAAVKEGAYDYVLKPFNLSEIKLAVNNALERARLTKENARLREIRASSTSARASRRCATRIGCLQFVLDAALERLDAERGSLMLVSARRHASWTWRRALACPWSSSAPHGGEMGNSISGWVAENVKPLLVPDIEQAPGHPRHEPQPGSRRRSSPCRWSARARRATTRTRWQSPACRRSSRCSTSPASAAAGSLRKPT